MDISRIQNKNTCTNFFMTLAWLCSFNFRPRKYHVGPSLQTVVQHQYNISLTYRVSWDGDWQFNCCYIAGQHYVNPTSRVGWGTVTKHITNYTPIANFEQMMA